MGVLSGQGVLRLAFGLALGVAAAHAAAQDNAPVGMDAQAMVRQAVANRLAAEKNHRPMQYLLHKVDERHDTTKEIVETQDGDVARLVEVNGQPLSAEAEQAELARLNDLETHPELQEKRKKNEQRDQERVDHLMGMLPDAFLYKVEGVDSCAAGRCYRLSFAPNPKWEPPDMEASFFRGVAGEVWISQAGARLTRLDAHFVADVNLGFGFLVRVNKGGTVQMEQTDVGGGDWELTAMTMHVTGRALLVKPLKFQVKQEASRFAPVPPMGYAAAIEMLKKFRLDAPAGAK
jgi:hypothetical protein